jgi:hypothetical protein
VTFHRAYYHCRSCGQGHCPLDDRLGLDGSRQSPTVKRLLALAGSQVPFRQAAELARQLGGLRLSTATTRRRTEEAGDRLHRQHQEQRPVRPARLRPWDFTLPRRDGRSFFGTVAYLGIDAFAVPTRGKQGDPIDWRMLYVGLLYSPDKQHTVYVADFDREAVASQMRLYACVFGLGQADTLVALTDGGNGLEGLRQRHFSQDVVCILDFWHACEHVHGYARLRYGAGAAAWAERAVGLMREGGGKALLALLQEEELPAECDAEVSESLRKLCGYVSENMHRMEYATYRERGWDIGSGPTEAGCKLLGGRLKGTGMRWEECPSAEVAALRALQASGEGLWEAFWDQRPQPKRAA